MLTNVGNGHTIVFEKGGECHVVFTKRTETVNYIRGSSLSQGAGRIRGTSHCLTRRSERPGKRSGCRLLLNRKNESGNGERSGMFFLRPMIVPLSSHPIRKV
jgi:hypothetical protein